MPTQSQDAYPNPASPRAPAAVPARVSRRLVVKTEDIDEARLVLDRIYSAATLEPVGDVPFGVELAVTSFGGVHFVQGDWRAGARVTFATLVDRYGISFSDRGAMNGQHASTPLTVASGLSAAVWSPDHRVSLEAGPGFQGRTFTLEPAVLSAHARALVGRDLPGPLVFEPALDLRSPGGAAIHHVVTLLRAEIAEPDASLLFVSALRDVFLTSLLTRIRHTASSLFSAPAPGGGRLSVQRAEEFIAAHATEPITLADIVTAAGVPARSLRMAFTQARGISPMESLRQRRFDIAHRLLREPAPDTTVASVAADLGFSNPGRFSIDYRKRFGTSPSDTLAAARAAAGLAPSRPRNKR